MGRPALVDPVTRADEPGRRRDELILGGGGGLVSLLLLLVRCLVPRPVGATDNGDGWRLLC